MYLLASGYTARKAAVIFLLVCYKVADGFADVYESEFQRNGNLHLTGKIQHLSDPSVCGDISWGAACGR